MSRSYVVFGKVLSSPFTTYIFIKSLYNRVQFCNMPFLLLQLSFGLFLFRVLDSQLVFHHATDKFILVLPRIGHNTL